MTFDWKRKVQELRNEPRSNNATDYLVKIVAKENANWLASVHHLTADENDGGSFAYFDVYCVQGERQPWRAVLWGWEGQSRQEQLETRPLYPDKPMNELPALHLGENQVVHLEIASGDRVENIHTGHGGEMKSDGITLGNKRTQHSFLVVFQEQGLPPSPLPGPPTLPSPNDPKPNDPVILDPPIVLGAEFNNKGHLVITIQVLKELE